MTQRDRIVGLTLLHCRRRKGSPRPAALVYRRDMPGRKRPTAEDAMTARGMLLDGLARGADVFEVLGVLASLHPRNDTFPGEVFLHLCGERARPRLPGSALSYPAGGYCT
jgi:hypothetical protein